MCQKEPNLRLQSESAFREGKTFTHPASLTLAAQRILSFNGVHVARPPDQRGRQKAGQSGPVVSVVTTTVWWTRALVHDLLVRSRLSLENQNSGSKTIEQNKGTDERSFT